MDNHSPTQRSYNMSRIRGTGNALEKHVRSFLFSKGFRYRINVKTLPGKPDIVMKKHKAAIFVNGCFWHMHENCRFSVLPKSNIEYWKPKLQRNVDNDKKHINALQSAGWNVYVLWECQLRKKNFENTMSELLSKINMKKSDLDFDLS